LKKLGGKVHHPYVKAGDCNNAGAAVNRLKKGPANIPEVIYDGAKHTDGDFQIPDSLFLNGYEDLVEESTMDNKIASGVWTWDSWNSRLPSNALFKNDNVTYTEPN
jgi:hypothetical protein